jgi:RNA polymerase sigma factor (sigma-70 family)
MRNEQVIAAIKDGRDDKVLGDLYEYVLPKVTAFIRTNNGSDDEAFDVFQDAIVILFKQVTLGKYDEQYDVGGFVYSVCRNLWINRVKKINKHVSTDSSLNELETKSHLDELYDEEKRKVVEYLFGKLDFKCKELLTLSIYKHLTMEDIALRLGFASENAAKTANYRCKKKMMELVKESKLFEEVQDW